MAKQTINIGSNANDGTGDTLRIAFNKINDNFTELYGSDNDLNTLNANLDVNNNIITTSVTNGNITVTPNGTGSLTLDAIKINGTTISSDDSTKITLAENIDITGSLNTTGAATLGTSLSTPAITLATGATITEFSTNTALGTSNTVVPTQNAVKSYVDTAVLSPRIGDLSVIGSTITAPSNGDLILETSGTGTVKILEDNISFGNQAGETSQGEFAVAIGRDAGRDTQGARSVAIGKEAGEITQGTESVAVGRQAGYDQGDYAVHIGGFAGGGTSIGPAQRTVGIGYGAGTNAQGADAIAIGYHAMYDFGSDRAIAIGKEASKAGGGQDSIAIGHNAMLSNSSAAYTTAIGYEAARSNSVGGGSDRAIAIGFRAGYATLHPNSIILNAESAALNTVGQSRFYVAPIRSDNSSSTVLQYDSSTKEITFTNSPTIAGTLTTTGIITTGDITAQGTVFSDKIKSPATNANLEISAQGTGVVDVQSAMTTVGQTITGTASVTGQFNADNIRIDGNTVSSTNANGNIEFTPNGSGQVNFNSARITAYQLNANTVALSEKIDTNKIASFASNADIVIEPQGTGKTQIINLNYREAAPFVVSYASTITPDVDNGNIQKVTLTGNVTFSAFNNPVAGQSLTLFVIQDATGSRLLTSTMKFAGGSKTLSTAAGSIDIITAYYDGTNYYATLAKAFA